MRVFMTGATGYIGGAIARAAREAGHEVLALARTEMASRHLHSLGYQPVFGDLTDTSTLAASARLADAVIHAAIADADGATIDRAATEAIVSALAGSRRPFIYTSGVWVLVPTGSAPADENSPIAPIPLIAWRGPLERALRAAADRGAHTVIVRPGVAYGHAGGIPGKIARGELPLVGDGEQRWPVVHVDDLAALYLAAAERAHPGAVLHGVGGVIRLRDLLRAEPFRAPSHRQAVAVARETLGDFADALALDQDVSADRTRATLGWRPRPLPTVTPGVPAGVR